MVRFFLTTRHCDCCHRHATSSFLLHPSRPPSSLIHHKLTNICHSRILRSSSAFPSTSAGVAHLLTTSSFECPRATLLCNHQSRVWRCLRYPPIPRLRATLHAAEPSLKMSIGKSVIQSWWCLARLVRAPGIKAYLSASLLDNATTVCNHDVCLGKCCPRRTSTPLVLFLLIKSPAQEESTCTCSDTSDVCCGLVSTHLLFLVKYRSHLSSSSKCLLRGSFSVPCETLHALHTQASRPCFDTLADHVGESLSEFCIAVVCSSFLPTRGESTPFAPLSSTVVKLILQRVNLDHSVQDFQLLLICGESDVTCLFHFESSFWEFFEVLKLCSSFVTVEQAREASIQVTTERKARRPEFHGIRRHVASLVGSMLRQKLCQCALLLAPVEKMWKTTRVLAPVVGQKFDAVIQGSSNQKTITPDEASLDLGTLRNNWGYIQKLRLRGPQHRTLGESVKHWTAWGQTLKFEIHSETPSPGNHVQDDIGEQLMQKN